MMIELAKPPSPAPVKATLTAGEIAPVLVCALWFFCVLAAYYVIRPVRDQFSAAVGSKDLWLFWSATLAVMLVLTPVFGAMVARLKRLHLIATVHLAFIACLLVFMPLFSGQVVLDTRLFGTIFYVWVSVFNLFVVSVFWSVMADIFDTGQAKRFFPLIALGGTAGAIMGPLLTTLLVQQLGIPSLLAISASLLVLATVCAHWLSHWSARSGTASGRVSDAPIGGQWLAGIRQVLASPFLRKMALLMLLGDAIGTVAYALVSDYVHVAAPDAQARTALFARLDLITNTLQVVLQVFIARWLLLRHGPGWCLLLANAVNVLILIAAAIIGGPAILAVLIVTRSIAYGIVKPAIDLLYTGVSREDRYKGKNFIETAVWRFGDVSVALLLKALMAIGFGMAGLSLLTALGATLAGRLGWRAAKVIEP